MRSKAGSVRVMMLIAVAMLATVITFPKLFEKIGGALGAVLLASEGEVKLDGDTLTLPAYSVAVLQK